MRHALVTGGAGFIGSHLVDRLLGEGWHVTTIDNFDPFYDAALKRRNIAQQLGRPAFELATLDIRDMSALSSLEGPFDVLVHLAAKAGVRPSIQDPMGYQQTNIQGTQNLLEFARQRHIEQFVFASSSSVYGTNPRVPWHEEDPTLRPISPYAATKVACELLGHVYSHLYGIRFIALRLFTVYGPRQRPDLAICKFARLMLEGKPIPVFGDGTSRRDYTFVDDVVAGLRAAMGYTRSGYEVINIGNSQTVDLLEMVRALEEVFGMQASLDWQLPQPGDVLQTSAEISKAQRLLGWHPQTPFAEGLVIFRQWLGAQKHQSFP